MKQRIFQRLLMTAAVAGLLLTVGAHAARRSVPVQVDADTLPVRGYVDSGVTYVPLRALLNGWTPVGACGGTATRDRPRRKVKMIRSGQTRQRTPSPSTAARSMAG